MADPAQHVSLGTTSLRVTQLGLGSTALGYLYSAIDDDQAHATVVKALKLGLNLFDTAPLYGSGLAESRLGLALSGFPRDSFVLSTKVGFDIDESAPQSLQEFSHEFYLHAPRDYSYDTVMRSIESSLRRLRLDRIDILHIHDPDSHFEEAMSGAYKALERLRAAGVIHAIGAGMNDAKMLTRFAEAGDFDCFVLAGRYTLLDQTGLSSLLPICERKKISVLIGGVYNSGILADPHAPQPYYGYLPASKDLVNKARRIDAICARHRVPIKAAAIQFPLSHPSVASVLCGARSATELADNEQMFRHPVPQDLWSELKASGLLTENASTAHL